MKPDFFRFRVFLRACSLQNEVGDHPFFFYISGIGNSSSYSGKSFRKKSMLENFRANVLKRKDTQKQEGRTDCGWMKMSKEEALSLIFRFFPVIRHLGMVQQHSCVCSKQ